MLNKVILTVFVLLVIISGVYALRDTKEYTTSSDEAYELYMESIDLRSKLYQREAYDKIAEAIKLDSNFAFALADFAMRKRDMGEKESCNDYMKRAMAQYDRLKGHEKLSLDVFQQYMDGNHDSALALTKKYVKAFPDKINGHQSLASFSWETGEIQEAIKEFELILEIDQEYAPAYNSLGYLEFGNGNFNKALEHFEKYLELLPDQANPFDSKGEILMAVGRYDEALSAFKSAHQIEPRFTFVLYHMADDFNLKGMYRKANQTFNKIEKLSENTRDSVTLLIYRSRTEINRGTLDTAGIFADKLLDLGEIHSDSYIKFWGHLFHAFRNSEIDIDQADYHLALSKDLLDSLLGDKAEKGYNEYSGSYQIAKAWIDVFAERYQDALVIEPILNEKMLWRPDAKIDIKNILAVALYHTGQKEKAYKYLNSNLDLNPNHPYALIFLAHLYEEDGMVDKAVSTLDHLFKVLKDADQDSPRILKLREKYEELTPKAASLSR
jgi:tetratricopeptide (TPR) repeat protein